MKKVVALMLCVLLCCGCTHKDPLAEVRNYRSDTSYKKTAPAILEGEKEGNLFIYSVLIDLERIYDALGDSYNSLFDLYDYYRSNKASYEVRYNAYEELRYSGNFVSGDIRDHFDNENLLMGKCDDISCGYYDYSSYTRNYAKYLCECYDFAESCPGYLDDILIILQDYSGYKGETQRISDAVIGFKESMNRFKQSIDALEPIRDWFFNDNG